MASRLIECRKPKANEIKPRIRNSSYKESFSIEEGMKSKQSKKPTIIKWNFMDNVEPLRNKTNDKTGYGTPTIAPIQIQSIPMSPTSYKKTSLDLFSEGAYIAGATAAILIMTAIPASAEGLSAANSNIIWKVFMNNIYPWFMSIARVFCVVKIAQGLFEQHSAGARASESGFGSIVKWGKWLIIFNFIPAVVELIDVASKNMLKDIQG